MNKSNRHIVSKINWDLGYDDRRDVQALQSTFGSWTKTDMLNEMNAIFNELCPPDQTWRITKLELDLGEMLKGDIDEELPSRFRMALYEKLIELTYRSGRGNHDLSVLNGDDALLGLLRKYLESGYLPWNETGVVSINELFLNQLKNNSKALLNMILVVGKSEKIRRRIAWQFQEPTIKKLIALIEPNNSTQIITFTEEFVAIQEKEPIVRSNVGDFKKNLWFWVLNHLFDERGTLFNRIEFMESSILQMAHHHNMDYAALFSEIQRAVEQITAIQHVDSGFILTLSLLAKKNKESVAYNYSEKHDVKVGLLINYFSCDEDEIQKKDIESWDDFIVHLDQKNSKRFKRILANNINENERLNTLVTNLNETGLTAFLHTVHGRNSFELIESIQLLSKWAKPHIQLSQWYRMLAQMSIDNKLASVNIELLLVQLLQRLNVAPQVLYQEMNEALKSGTSNSNIHPQVFKSTITTVRNYYFDAMESASKWTIVPYLEFFLSAASDQLSLEKSMDKLKGQSKFAAFLKEKPVAFFQFLENQPWNSASQQQFMEVLHNDQLLILRDSILNSSTSSLGGEINNVKVFLSSITSEMGTVFTKKVYVKSLVALLRNKASGASRVELFIKKIIQTIKEDGNSRMRIKLQDFSKELKEENLLQRLLHEQVEPRLSIVNPSFQNLLTDIQKGKAVKAQKSAENLAHLRESSGKDWISRFNQSLQILVPHLLPIENKWTKKLSNGRLNLHLIFGEKTFSNLSLKRQTVIFWNVLLAYESYNGNYKRFKNILQDALGVRDQQLQKVVMANSEAELPKNVVFSDNSIIESLQKVSKGHSLSAGNALNESIHILLKNNPSAFFNIIESVDFNPSVLAYFETNFSFDKLLLNLASSSATIKVAEFQSILVFLTALVNFKGGSSTHIALKQLGWKLLFLQLHEKATYNDSAAKLVQSFIADLTLNKGLKTKDILTVIQAQSLYISPFIFKILVNMNSAFANFSLDTYHNQGSVQKATMNGGKVSKEGSLALFQILNSKISHDLFKSLLLDHKIPNWFDIPEYNRADALLITLLQDYPEFVVQELSKSVDFEQFVSVLQKKINLTIWLNFLKTTYSSQTKLINQLKKLFNCFSSGDFSLTLKTQLTQILFRKTAISLKTGNWSVLSSEKIWNELVWESKVKYGLKEEVIIKAIQKNEAYLPVGLRVAFQRFSEKLQEQKNKKHGFAPKSELLNNKTKHIVEESPKLLAEGIAINNAGLVLANNYIVMMFDRLNLIKDGIFLSKNAQNKAVHYLQFLVNGIAENEEHYLVLNKIFVGLHPTSPVTSGIQITADEKELIEGLITAIISHWSAIGDTSVDGFRGNWLIRDGIIREEVDRWTLDVEKRAYDILLNHSPFSFGIIKYPWLEKPIHVNWPY